MATMLEEYTTEEQYSIVHYFLWAKGLNAKEDARPGRPVEIATEATVQRVEKLIRVDRRITIHSAATALGCSHGLAYSKLHDRLKFRKVCARWVRRELKDRGKIEPNGSVLATYLTVCRRRRYA
jgi:ribosomal protein S25